MRLIHAADIHLDSPLRGLAAYEGAPVRDLRDATRRAIENLVDVALEEHVDLVLLAGDLYDGDWPDFQTGQFMRLQLSRFAEAGIPVVAIAGNHDAESKLTKQLRLPEGVTILSAKSPETVRLDELGVAVHGQSYAKPATTANLVTAYPEPLDGYVNIGLLHTGLEGHPEHASYAPCSLADLLAKDYAYWALGHIHERRVVHDDPYVVFPGNIQGRHVRECGAKGATLVTIVDGDVSIEHRDLDHARWAVRTVDVSSAEHESDVLSLVEAALLEEVRGADGRLLAIRLVLEGSCPAHNALVAKSEEIEAEIQARACELAEQQIWIERIVRRTVTPIDLDALRDGDDAVADLLAMISELRHDDEALRELGREFEPLVQKLPPELRRGPQPVDPQDPDFLRATLDEVEQTLLPRLLEASH